VPRQGVVEAEKQSSDRRLASTSRAHESRSFASLRSKGDILYGPFVWLLSVMKTNVPEFDHRGATIGGNVQKRCIGQVFDFGFLCQHLTEAAHIYDGIDNHVVDSA